MGQVEVGGGVVVGVHPQAPAMDDHAADERAERVLTLHGVEIDAAVHLVDDAIDDRGQLVRDVRPDLDAEQATEHFVQDLRGRGHGDSLRRRWSTPRGAPNHALRWDLGRARGPTAVAATNKSGASTTGR